MSSVTVAKASVILAFQICNIWNWCRKHFVLNIPPLKEVKGGGDIRRSWWPGCRTISPNPPVWKCCIQKPNVTNVTINTWHKILEINLSNVKKNTFVFHVVFLLFVIRERLYAHPVFRQPLHVSSLSRPIIRRYNHTYTKIGIHGRTAPSTPYTRPTQMLSRPPPVQKLGAENHMVQLNI